jgi:hypothetical protein
VDYAAEVLLYVGACTDVYPLVFPHAWTETVQEYAYVDGLPNSG